MQSAVVLDLGDLRRQAEMLRERARADADQIIAEARTKAKEIVDRAAKDGAERGHKEGFEAGHAEGLKKGHDEAFTARTANLDKLEHQWASALSEFGAARQSILIEARTDLVRLAIMMTERILHRAIEVDPKLVTAQVEEALTLVASRTAVTILVHPSDIELVRDAIPGILSKLNGEYDVRIEASAGVTAGGAVLRGGDTEVDAQLETQLRRISEALLPTHSNTRDTNSSNDDHSTPNADARP